jgi:hypothetical protein
VNSPIRSLLLGSIILTSIATTAKADVTYLASSLETLYRMTPGGSVESRDMAVRLRAMHRPSTTGVLYVLGDQGGGGPATVYTLENAVSGTPALEAYANLTQFYGSLTGIGDEFYAFKTGDLYTLDLSDPNNPIETLIGTTAIDATAGAAYDPLNGMLYMLSYATDALYTINPATAAATLVGSVGIDALDFGAEWFEDELYAAVRNAASGLLEIGTVDVTSGL